MSNKDHLPTRPHGNNSLEPPLSLKVALVAGESSGDLLGAGLIRSIRKLCPNAEFAGVAGPRMIAEGCASWDAYDRLAVMGLGEVFRRLPELIRLRKSLRDRFESWQPDVFVGIDSPDFNLGLELMLRRKGIRTVHYVSPSLWAWRPRRVKKIRRAADLVLCLLPFETRIYAEADVPARFVGHPLADQIPHRSDRSSARSCLNLPVDGQVVALLPGSRTSEVRALADDFAMTTAWLAEQHRDLVFVAPMTRPDLASIFSDSLRKLAPGTDVRVFEGRSHDAIAAADVALLASGTATLEATLIKRPMVVAYRVSRVSKFVLKTFRLLKVDRFALPNLLSGEALVPEILQDEITPPRLGEAVLKFLDDPGLCDTLIDSFDRIHAVLQRNADSCAAQAVVELCSRKSGSISA